MHSAIQKNRFVGSVMACLVAVWLAPAPPAQAQSDWRDKSLRSDEQTSALNDADQEHEDVDAPNGDHAVKLNFFGTPWPKVLEKVAKQSGSTLVMQSVPTGRYTRRDRNKYSRTEALRILNQELEREGFRILEKDKFLIVLHLSALRKQYARPELPMDPEAAVAAAAKHKAVKTADAAHPDVRGHRSHDLDAATAADEPAIRLVSGEEQDAGAAEEQQTPAAAEPASAKSLTTTVIQAKNKPARDLAQAVYRAFKARTELVDQGPHGLPAFRAFRPVKGAAAAGPDKPITEGAAPEAREVLFTIEVNADKQEVIVEATQAVARDLAGLIRALDTPREDRRDTIEIIPAPPRTQRIARNLQPNVARLIAQRQQEAAEGGKAQAPAEGAPPGGNAAPNQEPKDVQGLFGGIQGEMRVESMEDLGVIILEGSEHDVALMMEVIRQIEKLSLAAVPEIELKTLKHVNSESLAALLTSVYEKLTAQVSQGGPSKQLVSIFPVVKPNAILILAPADDIKGIIGVVDKLDQPVDALTEFQVFPLKSAIASQLAPMIVEFYEQRAGLGARIKVVADVRTNSVIVQARPADLAEVGALILKLDRDASSSVAQMHIFNIKHASAAELADVINRAILTAINPATTTTGTQTPTGQQQPQQQPTPGPGPRGQGSSGAAAQQLQQPKSVVLEFLAPDGDTQKLVRSGILSDVRVTADPRINAIVVTAPQQSMQLMAALIAQLDRPASTESMIKIFPMVNSDADKMVTVLQQVFGLTQQQQQPGGGTSPPAEGIEDVESAVLPLRFSVEPRTNSIIAVGSAGAMLTVEAILLRLDQSDARGRKVEVVKLKNSPAADVAEAINNFLTSQRDLVNLDPNFISTTELLEREIIAVPETVTNSLLVSVTPRYYDEIMKMISRLDEAPAQVIIQALLVEVELQNTDEFGVELGFQDSVLFDRSLSALSDITTITDTVANPATGFSSQQQRIVSQQATPGFLFNNNGPLGNNVTGNTSTVGTQGIGNLGVGRVNSDLGFGGLVLSASSENISALLRALSSQRKIQVLSRPQIQTLDNQEATIQVGQQVPIVNGVTQGANFVNPTVTQQDIGIILTVVPRISPDDSIIMRAEAIKSKLAGQGIPIFFDTVNNRTIDSPIIDKTQALATVSVTSGQTIVLGGMITTSNDTLERKVPWLGDIPVVGRAFRFDSTTRKRTELLIFLTPRIVKTDYDSELIKQVEAERLHFIEEEAEMVHGPLYGIPSVIDKPPAAPAVPEGQPATSPSDVPLPAPSPDTSTSNGHDDKVPTSVVPQRLESIRLIDQTSATESQQDAKPQGPALSQAASANGKSKAKPRLLPGTKSNSN